MSALKRNKLLTIIILIIGIVLRIVYQFIFISYNVDEVNLASNIVNSGYWELLYPLKNGQSAPPLFLVIQKFTSQFGDYLWSFKVLSFLSSTIALVFIFTWIKEHKYHLFWILGFFLFSVSPFVIYNSLTLKQYTFDLSIGLLLCWLLLRAKKPNNYFIGIVLTLSCLLSNMALFYCVAFGIVKFVNVIRHEKWSDVIKSIAPYVLSPFIYVCYFLWFINQEGANELRLYMSHYWEGAFLPLDASIFDWTLSTLNGIGSYFFSAYRFLSVILCVLSIIGFINFWNSILTKNKTSFLSQAVLFYSVVLVVHLVFSACHLYPFSDRLYLYLAPLVYACLAHGFYVVFKYIPLETMFSRLKESLVIVLIVCLGIMYNSYLPYKENDVLGLMSLTEITNNEVAFTNKAYTTMMSWNSVFNTEDVTTILAKSCVIEKDSICEKSYLISRQHHKFGAQEKHSSPEAEVLRLLNQKKIKEVNRVDGYAVYVILD